MPDTLDHLALESLRLAGPDPQNWVPDRHGVEHNVLVVGGGHTGVAVAYGLRRAGIGKVSVIDSAAGPAEASLWRRVARMHKLRTPKTLVGPEGGNPALSFQAWYEARHGQAAYAAIDRIARTDWADYVDWYRQTVGVAVRYGVRLDKIVPQDGYFRLELTVNGAPVVETTRKIVLATGFLGAGGATVPDVLRGLPSSHLHHTSEQIDFSLYAGQRIAVIGGAASAFDAAAVALEARAAEVHLFSRRAQLAATAVGKVRGYPGAYDNYAHIPDAIRWQLALRTRRAGTTAPNDSIERATRFDNFHLHLGASVSEARLHNGQALIVANGERFLFDQVIAATGYATDPALRPELAPFADQILRWRDRYTPPADQRDDDLGNHPYLGFGLELQEREAGSAPWLRDIHVQNPTAIAARGVPVGDVPSMKRDLPATIATISRDLFLADIDVHQARFQVDIAPDFTEALYAKSVWKRAEAAE